MVRMCGIVYSHIRYRQVIFSASFVLDNFIHSTFSPYTMYTHIPGRPGTMASAIKVFIQSCRNMNMCKCTCVCVCMYNDCTCIVWTCVHTCMYMSRTLACVGRVG